VRSERGLDRFVTFPMTCRSSCSTCCGSWRSCCCRSPRRSWVGILVVALLLRDAVAPRQL